MDMKVRKQYMTQYIHAMNFLTFDLKSLQLLRDSSYEPRKRAGLVTRMNFLVSPHGKFQPSDKDKIQEINQYGTT